MLKSGIYDELLTVRLVAELEKLDPGVRKIIREVSADEIPVLVTQYLKNLIYERLNRLETEDIESLSYLKKINGLIEIMAEIDDDASVQQFPPASLRLLSSLIQPEDVRYFKQAEIEKPETPISYSSLFTGSKNEPALFTEFKKEIKSSDQIDFLVSFIKWSGIRLILDDLKNFTDHGGRLRILTTSYMGATDPKAVDELSKLANTEVKISYDTKRTRLHAKTYIFHRFNGYTTAYVGSSNLSNAAISSGLEWNMKLAKKDQSDILEKINSTFDTYWSSAHFELYTSASRSRLIDAIKYEKSVGTPAFTQFDLRPFAFQQELLDQLEAEREIRHHYKNLIVAATGTGKTMISAFDFKNFRIKHPQARLLFVAHRKEILKQSLDSFRAVLRDPNFGELYVSGYTPDNLKHLFVSIQSYNAGGLDALLDPGFYDYIVVDEFHHAAAPSYQSLLGHFEPKILLGLTATPERMDGKNVLDYFDDRIAAELRLPEAIERKLLVPFHYFGVTDTQDLTALRWTKGGYEASQLNEVYVLDHEKAKRRADQIAESMERYLTDLESTKALGFCVSKQHARFMADYFNGIGISSLSLTSDSSSEVRDQAKAMLRSGAIKVIFVVDLYNEGVDIPEINTVLFLRPTESLTVFLQQLGRGLRLAPNKDCLTVLDFIGQQHKKYSFENKFKALLVNKKHSLKSELKNDFLNLPIGCYIKLEKTPKEIILNNIKKLIGTRSYIVELITEYHALVQRDFELSEFLNYWNKAGKDLSLEDIYRYRQSFARLKAAAGVVNFSEFVWEDNWNKCLPKICGINSRHWIRLLKDTLTDPLGSYSPRELKMLQMFQVTFWGNLTDKESLGSCLDTLSLIRSNPMAARELHSLLDWLNELIDFVDEPVSLGIPSPLDLHCHYTRDQLLVALGYFKPGSVMEGVKYLPEIRIDVLMNTLQKSEKHYSPTTMYKDYSINEELFHWQSQNATSADSQTGRRYIHHRKEGSQVLLFVRESRANLLGTAPYTFLGLADYVSHEGSRPMSIIWKLRRPIPASLIESTNKLGIV